MNKKGVEKTDHSILEHVAEDLTTYHLQDKGLLVAKPKNDQNGADLLVFRLIEDGVKFCRAQCKGRTVSPVSRAHIEIPQNYVTGGFVLFLYLTTGIGDGTLYFFDPNIIRSWKTNKDGKYVLNIPQNYKDSWGIWKFNTDSITQIETIIQDSDRPEGRQVDRRAHPSRAHPAQLRSPSRIPGCTRTDTVATTTNQRPHRHSQ